MISFGCQVLKNISKNSNSHCDSCEQKSQTNTYLANFFIDYNNFSGRCINYLFQS